MTPILQVGDRTITADQIISLLTSYQMLPRLLVKTIIDQAIAPITCTFEKIVLNYRLFSQKNQLSTET